MVLRKCLADLGDLLADVTETGTSPLDQAAFLWTEKPQLSGALGDASRVPSPLAGQEVLNFPELPVQRTLHILHFFPLLINQNSDLLVENQQ